LYVFDFAPAAWAGGASIGLVIGISVFPATFVIAGDPTLALAQTRRLHSILAPTIIGFGFLATLHMDGRPSFFLTRKHLGLFDTRDLQSAPR
jgi:hypothetical protein